PSGALAEYTAIAIGREKKEAMKLFEKDYKENLPLEEGIELIMRALQRGLDEKEKLDVNRLDFALIEEGTKFERIPKQKLKSILGKK
ncbi:MAG: hypothetical protein Q8N60_03995, partial [Candidatus Diapherotrites archaeon]|nr:hypothetical protein [Candidatus Diapherotrites archaeon]